MSDDFAGWEKVPAESYEGWEKVPAQPAAAAIRRGPAPSEAETFAAVHGQNATLGLGDQLGGAFQGSLVKARALLDWLANRPTSGHVEQDALDVMRHATTENRDIREAGIKLNPWSAALANVTGQVFNPANLMALSPLSRLSAAVSSPLSRFLPQFLARRAGTSLAAGTLASGSAGLSALNETGNLGVAGQRALHAVPMGLAAGFSPVLTGGGLAGSALFSDDPNERANRTLAGLALMGGGGLEALSRSGPTLKDISIAHGRRVLTGGADSLANKAPISDAVVEEALRSKAIAPFGTTKGAAERLAALRESVGEQYGQVVDALASKGLRGPEAAGIADAWLQRAAQERATSLSNQSIPNLFQEQAEAIASKPGDDGSLGLGQALEMTRKLQKEARYGKYEDTPLNEAKQEQAADLRVALEDVIKQQASLAPEEAARFEPLKARLSRLIEASKAAEKGAGQASRRNAFSLRDTALAAAELAHGNPLGAVEAAGASHLLRTRLPSTVARGAYGASDLLSWLNGSGVQSFNPALLAPLSYSSRQEPLLSSWRTLGALAGARPAEAR